MDQDQAHRSNEEIAKTTAAWLVAHVDSHDIVDLGWATVELRELGYRGTVPPGWRHREVARAIAQRGLGGELKAEDYPGQRLVAGYELARHLAKQLLGVAPGDAYSGRGSAYRANVEALAGAVPTTSG